MTNLTSFSAFLRFPLFILICSLGLMSPAAVSVQDETEGDAIPPAASAPDQDEPTAAEPNREDSGGTTEDENSEPNSLLKVDMDSITAFARRMQGQRKYSRISSEIVELMSPVISSASPSTVRVYSESKQIAIGTIVDSNGLILTIADELKSPVECRLPDGSLKPATVFGLDGETGLAMLKVDVNSLTTLPLQNSAVANVGDWLASVSPDRHPISIGVVSVLERAISGGGAFIGIQMDDHPKGVRITRVIPDTPADKADLFINDVITSVAGQTITSRMDLSTKMREYSPGDSVEMTVLRNNEELSFELVLAARNQFDAERNEQNRMGSILSRRRQGFERAFQHDSFLQANECGSPVVNIDGKVVGINIARSGRVSSLALPISVVMPAIERLQSGELAPVKVNAKQIAIIEKELASLADSAEDYPAQLAESEAEQIREEAKIEEMKEMLLQLQSRLDELEAQNRATVEKTKELASKNRQQEIRKRRLTRELEQLKQGTRN